MRGKQRSAPASRGSADQGLRVLRKAGQGVGIEDYGALTRKSGKHHLTHLFPDPTSGADHDSIAPDVLQKLCELHLALDRPDHDSKISGSIHGERISRARMGNKTRACPECSPRGDPGCTGCAWAP